MASKRRDDRRSRVQPPDPTDPLVVDVQELGRRPGASMQIHREVVAEEGWGTPAMQIPAGAPVELDVLAESVVEGVLLTGVARAEAAGECSRCLEPLAEPVVAEVSELCLWEDRAEAEAEEGEFEDQPIVVVEDRIDLREAIRDSLLLSLPLVPLCSEDCAGLCPQCGIRMADNPGHRHEIMDPRWSALEALRETGASEGGDAEG